MTVLVLDCAPESVRGEITRWFLELKPGVFIGRVSARVRDLLWERICKEGKNNGAILAYHSTNEQGFEMRLYGEPRRKVVELEGVQLIKME